MWEWIVKTGEDLLTKFQQGGGTMYWILALSVLALAVAIERAVRLRRSKIVPKGLADQARQLWDKGDRDGLLALCRRRDSSLARAITAVLDYRRASVADARIIAGDIGSAEMRPHHRRLIWLAVVVTLAPMLGLFGTVIGMITAFQQFRLLGETGDPSVFAGAISLALITTAYGLVVAMPALFLHNLFKSYTVTLADELETQLAELTVEWFIEADPAGAGESGAASVPAGKLAAAGTA